MRGFRGDDGERRQRREDDGDDEELRTVTFAGMRVLKETPRALLVAQGDPRRQFWVPQSVIHSDSEVYAAGTTGKLVVQAWWAKREGYVS